MSYGENTSSAANVAFQRDYQGAIPVKEGELSGRLIEANAALASIAERLDAVADRIAPEPRELAEGGNVGVPVRPSLSDKVSGIHRHLQRVEQALLRIENQI